MNRNAKRKAAQARRNVLLVVALMLVVCVASIGGTIAWLTDKTEAVTNTFAPADINIELKETLQSDGSSLGTDDWKAELIPGKAYTKNPTVTVKEGSEKCYLFVEVNETNSPSSYLDYSYIFDNEGSVWTNLSDGVWYTVVEESDADQTWNLIDGDSVTVRTNVIKPVPEGQTAPDGFVEMPSEDLSISFKAYAIQYSSFEPEISEGETEPTDAQKNTAALAAWNEVK